MLLTPQHAALHRSSFTAALLPPSHAAAATAAAAPPLSQTQQPPPQAVHYDQFLAHACASLLPPWHTPTTLHRAVLPRRPSGPMDVTANFTTPAYRSLRTRSSPATCQCYQSATQRLQLPCSCSASSSQHASYLLAAPRGCRRRAQSTTPRPGPPVIGFQPSCSGQCAVGSSHGFPHPSACHVQPRAYRQPAPLPYARLRPPTAPTNSTTRSSCCFHHASLLPSCRGRHAAAARNLPTSSLPPPRCWHCRLPSTDAACIVALLHMLLALHHSFPRRCLPRCLLLLAATRLLLPAALLLDSGSPYAHGLEACTALLNSHKQPILQLLPPPPSSCHSGTTLRGVSLRPARHHHFTASVAEPLALRHEAVAAAVAPTLAAAAAAPMQLPHHRVPPAPAMPARCNLATCIPRDALCSHDTGRHRLPTTGERPHQATPAAMHSHVGSSAPSISVTSSYPLPPPVFLQYPSTVHSLPSHSRGGGHRGRKSRLYQPLHQLSLHSDPNPQPTT
jgi:hypothetical protein